MVGVLMGFLLKGLTCLARVSERCRNPWDAHCRNSDIVLYISFRGVDVPICSRCWRKIAGMDVEW